MDVLLGVGNDANGDDGIGPWIARRLDAAGWRAVDCFTVPENYTGELRRMQPRRVVIIDAADMGLQPGDIRVVPRSKTGSATFTTHAMPLGVLIDYIEGITDAHVTLVGVQPQRFDEMSEAVKHAGERLLQMLASDGFEGLPRL